MALDFFTVLTISSSSDWVVQPLREAFPDLIPYRYAILDWDKKFDGGVLGALRSIGLQAKRTSRE